MKLGLGLYRHLLNRDNYRFARQIGATHIVAHLVDYGANAQRLSAAGQPVGNRDGWGQTVGTPLWTSDELVRLRREIEAEGLTLAAIENFDPAHWHDVLLDGPHWEEHIENLRTLITRVGDAGIPIIGYNFSLAGVAGRSAGPFARGSAITTAVDGTFEDPLPLGMVWNMVYDPRAPAGVLPKVTPAELWDRFERYLRAVLPTAERMGVKLAAHPDDPPFAEVRGQPRLVYQPRFYRDLLRISNSPSNVLELCLGSIAEMTEENVYDVVAEFSQRQRIGYIHFRNVAGTVPKYQETFIDDGDIDMAHVVEILRTNGYDGVLIPDHTPQVTSAAPWHAGMAHALGYMKALVQQSGNRRLKTRPASSRTAD